MSTLPVNLTEGALKQLRKIKLDQNISEKKRITVKDDLIEYCKMDTFAMVEIIKKLKDL